VYERSGYVLDPHSAIGYLGITGHAEQVGQGGPARRAGQAGIFLATAHPAKFPEVVEPVIGRSIEKPAPLVHALAQAGRTLRIDATIAAVREAVGA
jgi:threonine synthase